MSLRVDPCEGASRVVLVVGFGVVGVGFLSVIGRLLPGGRLRGRRCEGALRDEMPRREIAGRTGLSRGQALTARGPGDVAEHSRRPSVLGKLGPYADRLSAWPLVRTRTSRKKRRAVKQMQAELAKPGYDGS